MVERCSPRGFKLCVAAIFRDEAGHIAEWVAYHRLVGVEHFLLYDDDSGDDWREALRPELEEGIVEVHPAPKLSGRTDRQMNAYKDALTRSRSRTQWLAVIDLDEFIVPLDSSSVAECLQDHFPAASAVYANWRNFGVADEPLRNGQSLLATLTRCTQRDHPTNGTGKSLVRPDRVRVSKAWSPHHFVLEPGAVYYNGDGDILGVSQIEPLLDSQMHDRHLQINHYQHRDDIYFQLKRLIKDDSWVEWDHYREFTVTSDFTVIDFLRERHPEFARTLIDGR